jgi:hypothetical protein
MKYREYRGERRMREDRGEGRMREDGGEGSRTMRRKNITYLRTLDRSDSVSSA